MSLNYYQEALAIREDVVGFRRDLHQIPEVALQLPQTVAYVAGKLAEMGVPYEVYEDCSCISATIGQGGKCILLRADMDALPVPEETGLPFASTNGCSHACGHDCHTASLLGAAKILKAHEAELEGTVKLIFQSAEETFQGASAAIRHGIMENPHVDAAFGTHIFSIVPINTVSYGLEQMASVYGFKISITGKGTHGSSPELGVDPLTVGAYILLGLQELIAREVSAFERASLTIGHFEGGSVANVIPHYATLEGTLRTFKPEVREFIISRIHEVVNGIASVYRAKAEIEVLSSVPAVITDENMAASVSKWAEELDDKITVTDTFCAMGSEDFAFYGENVPSMLAIIGGGMEDKSLWVGHHHPKILFNEDALPIETALYAKVGMEWLKANK